MRFYWATWVALVGAGCFSKPDFTGVIPDGPPGDTNRDAAVDAEAEGPQIGPCAWNTIGDLRLYLPLDGPGTIATDLSGLGHTATVHGGATTVPGRVTRAMAFGGNDWVQLASDSDLDDLGPLSVCAWIYMDEPPDFAATIIDKSWDGKERGWNFYVEKSTGNRLGFLTTKRHYVHGVTTLPTDQWVHVCATWDGTATVANIALYRNGQPEAIAGSAMLDPSGEPLSDVGEPLVLGRQSNGNMYNLDGRIDELYLFAKVLSPTEVTELYSCAQ